MYLRPPGRRPRRASAWLLPAMQPHTRKIQLSLGQFQAREALVPVARKARRLCSPSLELLLCSLGLQLGDGRRLPLLMES
jgi:hypothetical protein